MTMKTEQSTDHQKNEGPAQPSTKSAGEPAPGGTGEGAGTVEQMAELKAQAEKGREHWEQLLRTTADFDNFKKRAAREKQDAVKYATESLLQKLLPILDNFDMAISAAAQAKENAAQSLQTGVSMILTQFRNALNEAGVEEIDAVGKKFDPNFHEA